MPQINIEIDDTTVLSRLAELSAALAPKGMRVAYIQAFLAGRHEEIGFADLLAGGDPSPDIALERVRNLS